MDKTTGWCKLTEENQWGRIEYRAEGVRRPLNFEKGAEARVRFPDGFEMTVKLEMTVKTIDVYDMGHTNKAEQRRFGVTVDVHGIKTWIPIHKLEVWL